MQKCDVPYCNQQHDPDARVKHQRKNLCTKHARLNQYANENNICGNRFDRAWNWPKIAKFYNEDFCCDICGTDVREKIKGKSLQFYSFYMITDHIIADLKHTSLGECDENYQVICRDCDAVKTFDNKDCANKQFKITVDLISTICDYKKVREGDLL